MPIYAYKCESCGFAKDVLQKISDLALSVCPHCAAPAFKKQVTAAGFQLKGSGWYVTDFRGGSTGGGSAAESGDAAASAAVKTGDSAAPASTTSAPAAAAASAPATSAAAPASTTVKSSSSKDSA